MSIILTLLYLFYLFFFSSRRRHTRWTGDWSSDVCSSDLFPPRRIHRGGKPDEAAARSLAERQAQLELGRRLVDLIHDEGVPRGDEAELDRKSTRLNSSHPSISYAVFCLKKKQTNKDARRSAGI